MGEVAVRGAVGEGAALLQGEGEGGKLYRAVAEKLRRLIDGGAYAPGTRLPGERELAEQFNVSRVTIREAGITLQAQGYLDIRTGSGAYVCDRGGAAGQRLPEVSAFELTEARLLFESEAAALAARSIGDGTLARLEALTRKMGSDDPQDEAASQAADREFHLTIAAASGNAAVQHVVETLWRMRTELSAVREAHQAVCSKENAKERGAEHAAIVTALRQHDPQAARTAMQKHFTRLLASMINATEERAISELRQKTTGIRERFLNNVAEG